jgi:hypothetical protein
LGNDRSVLLSSQAVPGGIRIDLPLRDLSPGDYEIVNTPEATGPDSSVVLMALGINPDRAESNLETLDPELWQQALITAGWKRSQVLSSDSQDVVAAVQNLDSSSPLWLILVGLALVFLLVEMILLKRKSAKPKALSAD